MGSRRRRGRRSAPRCARRIKACPRTGPARGRRPRARPRDVSGVISSPRTILSPHEPHTTSAATGTTTSTPGRRRPSAPTARRVVTTASAHSWRGLAQAAILIGSLAVAVLGPAMAIYHASQLRELPSRRRRAVPVRGPVRRRERGAQQSRRGNCSSATRPSGSSCRSLRLFRQRCTSSSIASGWRRSKVGGAAGVPPRPGPSGRSRRPGQVRRNIESSFGVLGPSARAPATARTPFTRGRRHDPRHHRVDRAGDRDEHPRARARRRPVRGPMDRSPWRASSTPRERRWALPSSAPTCSRCSTSCVLPTSRSRPEDVQHDRRADPRRLRAHARRRGDGPGDALDNRAIIAFAFFAGFLPQSALVRPASSRAPAWATVARARRACAADRARRDRSLRPHAARRGGHQQRPCTRLQRHRRTDELDLHPRRSPRRLDRPGDPLPPCRRRPPGRRNGLGGRPDGHAEEAAPLRRFGIRNASDLLQAFEAAVARGEQEAAAGESDEPAIRARAQREVDQPARR